MSSELLRVTPRDLGGQACLCFVTAGCTLGGSRRAALPPQSPSLLLRPSPRYLAVSYRSSR